MIHPASEIQRFFNAHLASVGRLCGVSNSMSATQVAVYIAIVALTLALRRLRTGFKKG